MKAVPTVAVINSISDVIEGLESVIKEAGYHVVTALIADIRKGNIDLREFIQKHDPFAIVYDVPPPYEENWKFLQLLQSTDVMKGRTFILTTTNKRGMEELVGDTPAIELIGRPFDFESVVELVKKAELKRS